MKNFMVYAVVSLVSFAVGYGFCSGRIQVSRSGVAVQTADLFASKGR